jgi:hypothetical protein
MRRPGGDVADVRYWSGLAADADGRFHPLWISDPTGGRPLWTRLVELEGAIAMKVATAPDPQCCC